jgi:AbrB family looped-hinge helix DNA binding protein
VLYLSLSPAVAVSGQSAAPGQVPLTTCKPAQGPGDPFDPHPVYSHCLAIRSNPAYLTFVLPNEAAMSAKPKLTTTVSTKGQVILPKVIREQRHWPAGTELVVEDTPEGVLLKAKPIFAPTRPKDVFGSLPCKGPAKSIADMEGGIASEAKRRHARNRY